MNSGVPWDVKGVRREVLDTAREAARRSGMSVAEWLDTVITESAKGAGVDPAGPTDHRDREPRDLLEARKQRRHADYNERQRRSSEGIFSEVSSRLDTLAGQIGHLTQATTAHTEAHAEPRRSRPDDTPNLIADALSRLDSRLDRLITEGRSATSEIEKRVTAIDRVVARLDREATRPAGGAPTTALDHAMAEIEARQRALDGEASAPRLDLARAPTQGLSSLEDQLRQISSRFDTVRPTIDNAVETLRDDLAEIGVMLKEAVPRHAVEALESEVRKLAARLDSKRHSGADAADFVGIERGLAEVRDALHTLTPAENLVGFEDAVNHLGQKIDRIANTSHDPAALKQLEGAIVALRGVVSSVASDDALKTLADEVRTLGAKIDAVAGSDAFSALEHRIASLADALQSHNNHGRDTHAVDAMVERLSDKIERLQLTRGDQNTEALDAAFARLSDKIERLQLTRGDQNTEAFDAAVARLSDKLERLQFTSSDQAAVGHLEDRIVMLVEKLDQSDARLNHLDAIERGLTELLLRFEHQRAPAPAPENQALVRDVQRTQDSLEAVHGTLGHVVDRLATIESSLRESRLPTAPHIQEETPAAAPAAPEPFAAFEPAVPIAAPEATLAPADAAPAPPWVAPLPPPPPIFAPAPAEKPPAAAAPAPTASPPPMGNPAPAAARPIDPNLPPDHPLEPGISRGRGPASPAERIAASEAALGDARPPVIPDPAGKSNFILAARRAAQAAVAEAPPTKDKRPAAVAPTGSRKSILGNLGGGLGGKVRKLLVGAGTVLVVLGSIHIMMNMLRSSGTPSDTAAQTPKTESPPPAAVEPVAPAPAAPSGRQSMFAPPAATIPIPGMPTGISLQGTAPEPETTGTVQPAPQTGNVPTANSPQPQPSPARSNGADRLPAAIGSSGLRAAAVKGDSAAEYEVAVRYSEGRGVPQSLAEAAIWFERAANQGLVPAQFRLGGLYEKGMGVRKNIDTARRLYLAAGEAGHAKAMHNLAVLYAEGVDGRPDYATAARWFRKAADHGVVDSQYNLAILYARGIGVETNFAEAFKWFALAGRDGDRDAQRKRDDVANRLDKQSLAAAMQVAQAWQPQPQPESATDVRAPAGGWDAVAAPSAASRRVGPKADTSPRRPAQ